MPKSTNRIKGIYMDYASSALPVSANPGAIHELGVKEKNKLENARKIVANILNAHKDEIVFTSGATESNNLAILGLMHLSPTPLLNKERGKGVRLGLPHIVTTNIEHASVLEICKHLENLPVGRHGTRKAEVTYVPVEKSGVVDPKKIKRALRKNTVLVSVMYANNEIGTIQPIREIAKEIRHWRKTRSDLTRPWHPLLIKERVGERCIFPLFHTDAVQAVNYLPINVAQLGIDMMSMNGAKIYGPKGVGVLYVKKNTPLSPIMFGGNQEFGLRPGTENVASALEFAKALQITEQIKEKEVKRLTKLRDYFFAKLFTLQKNDFLGPRVAKLGSTRPFKKESFVPLIFNGDLKKRLPNNVNITIPNIPSDLLVIELSARGIMASAKSACKAGDGKDSHVILAIRNQDGLPAKALATAGSLRFSLGRQTTKSDIDYTVNALSEILTKLKKWYD